MAGCILCVRGLKLRATLDASLMELAICHPFSCPDTSLEPE